jgi:streptomycin 6-kinase
MLPELDDALRTRLVARYGREIESWLDALPPILHELAERWQLEPGDLIPRGNMSVVMHCTTAEGEACVLKVCPDRERLATEGVALQRWRTDHVPAVRAVDSSVGAMLMEAIVPGTMLVEATTYPVDAIAELVASLHTHGDPDASYPLLGTRIAYLFDAWARHRVQHPELMDVVPDELFDRGRGLAERLARDVSPTVLLHGDLTPVNVLDGGAARGLVAIDPAPAPGDPAFDAVDLLFWEATTVSTIVDRAHLLAPTMQVTSSRLLDWCIAFAGMVASELAATPGSAPERVEAALTLARS